MRVLHVITRMIIGGAQENTLFNCLDLQQAYGDDVLLVTGPALGPEGRLLEQGRAGGLPLRFIDELRRSIHPTRDRQAYRALVDCIREFNPDVVHTHSAKGGFLGRAAAWSCGVPVVVHTVHGAPFHPYQNAMARHLFIRLERWAARRCHHMISVADAMTDLMVASRVAPREKFTTIYSGMDVEPFRDCNQFRQAARQELGFADDDVVFGKIARLFHLKGHEYLLEAAESAIRQNPKCKFLLVGDGILRQQLESRLASRHLQGHFRFTGLVEPERVPYYLSAMDALVHTSLREGLARTLPQALIAGKPVVSYDVDGAREVALPGQTGYLLPPKSIEPLRQAIVELSLDAELRSRLGQGGAARFTEQFRHQQMTRQIRALYQRLLPQQRP
ncbi:glycosyltransferase family 4 protein [Aureliella helgolandensis]|uniref:Alpha-D-kanosaminyltransferase n=1 Tax=Aureliella helgolandensis TaxID=2527968 RepID=A0A518GFB1_9BACT|nr:glycosyltransferase family 4 protein [Aureliella helgolandensis]QDV27291.1 Alpha-D-kanosaminyltransferase [Aureliella helgolandensis]